MKILITGSNGFIGQNLITYLRQREAIDILAFDIEDTSIELDAYLAEADFVYHLAGVNRPPDEDSFFTGNAELTEDICNRLSKRSNPPPLLISSSIQAVLDNPYGRSKRLAEEAVSRYSKQCQNFEEVA